MDSTGGSGKTVVSGAIERRMQAPPSAMERRCEQRYSAFGSPILVGWWEGDDFREQDALLRDVSLRGASATLENAPPPGETILVRLSGGQSSDWVEADVIEARKTEWTGRAPYLLRLRFQQPCPYDFFTGAIKGYGLQGRTPAEVYVCSPERRACVTRDPAERTAVPVPRRRVSHAHGPAR
jgi:hypothetical protein